jgi:hypothetical protein
MWSRVRSVARSVWLWEIRPVPWLAALVVALLLSAISIALLFLLVLQLVEVITPDGRPVEFWVVQVLSVLVFLAALGIVAVSLALSFRGIAEFRKAPVIALVVLVVVPLLVLRGNADPPTPEETALRQLDETRAAQRFDVVLALDPGQRVARRLSADRRRPWRFARRPGTVAWDTRLAPAIVQPLSEGGGAGEPFTLFGPLEADRRRFAARVPKLPETGPRLGSYTRVLDGLLRLEGIFRERDRLAVVLPVDALPNPATLDAAARAAEGDAALTWDAFLDRLAALGREEGGRRRVVLAVASGPTPDVWHRAVDRARGALTIARRDAGDRHVLDAAEDAVTGAPRAWIAQLARAHRPHLLFDGDERSGPIDIDAMLAERDGDRSAHRACRREERDEDPCADVRTGYDLLAGRRSHLDISGGSGLEQPDELEPTRARPHRMYFHATRASLDRVHLDYWWFFRFNASPVAGDAMCRAGLSLKDLTCFDHEGDWEGVTVTVERANGRWTVDSAVYGQHADRVLYSRAQLEALGALRREHVQAYVAYGSHAAYPKACAEGDGVFDCRQVRHPGRPEGNHDGSEPWRYNADGRCLASQCTAPLPVTPEGKPGLWNGFTGRWGRAACTVIAMACVLSDGPASPAAQPRYREPGAGTPAPGRKAS